MLEGFTIVGIVICCLIFLVGFVTIVEVLWRAFLDGPSR